MTPSTHCWHRFLGIRMLLPWPGWGGCRCCWCGGQQLLRDLPDPEECRTRLEALRHGPYRWTWSRHQERFRLLFVGGAGRWRRSQERDPWPQS